MSLPIPLDLPLEASANAAPAAAVSDPHEGDSAVPGAKARLRRRRSDSLPANLVFSEDEIVLHQDMHQQGAFKKGHLDSLVRKYLRPSDTQYLALKRSIQPEKLFEKYEDDPKYKYIFNYTRDGRDVLTCSRYLKVSTRPLVLAMSCSTGLAHHVRKAREKVGYTYPREPKEVEICGPTPVLNYVSHSRQHQLLPSSPSAG